MWWWLACALSSEGCFRSSGLARTLGSVGSLEIAGNPDSDNPHSAGIPPSDLTDVVAAEGTGQGDTLDAAAVAEVDTRPDVEVCNPAGTGAVVGNRPVALEVDTRRALEVRSLDSAGVYSPALEKACSPVPGEACNRDSAAVCSPGSAGNQVDCPQTVREDYTAAGNPLHVVPTVVHNLPDLTSILPVLPVKPAQAHSNHQDSLEPAHQH